MDTFDASVDLVELFSSSTDSISLLATVLTLILVFFPVEASFPTLARGWLDVMKELGGPSAEFRELTLGDVLEIEEMAEEKKVPRRIKAIITAFFSLGAICYFIMLDVSSHTLGEAASGLPENLDFRYIALLITLFVIVFQSSRLGKLSHRLLFGSFICVAFGWLFGLAATLFYELAVFDSIGWWVVLLLCGISLPLGWLAFRFGRERARSLAEPYTDGGFDAPEHVISPSSALLCSAAAALMVAGACYYLSGALCAHSFTWPLPLEHWENSDGSTVDRYYNVLFVGTKYVKKNPGGDARKTVEYERGFDHGYGDIRVFNGHGFVSLVSDCEKYEDVNTMVEQAKRLSEQDGYVYGVVVEHSDKGGNTIRSCSVDYDSNEAPTGYVIRYYRTDGERELYRVEEYSMDDEHTGYRLYTYDENANRVDSITHYSYDVYPQSHEDYRLDYDYGDDGRWSLVTKVPLAEGVIGYTGVPTYRYGTDNYLESEKYTYAEKYGVWVSVYHGDAKETYDFYQASDAAV